MNQEHVIVPSPDRQIQGLKSEIAHLKALVESHKAEAHYKTIQADGLAVVNVELEGLRDSYKSSARWWCAAFWAVWLGFLAHLWVAH